MSPRHPPTPNPLGEFLAAVAIAVMIVGWLLVWYP